MPVYGTRVPSRITSSGSAAPLPGSSTLRTRSEPMSQKKMMSAFGAAARRHGLAGLSPNAGQASPYFCCVELRPSAIRSGRVGG